MRHRFIGILFLVIASNTHADSFAARVSCVALQQRDQAYWLSARIFYMLSPKAKEALSKGVPLTWDVAIKVQQSQRWWNSTLSEQHHRYTLEFHALLNQYSVRHNDQNTEAFLSLNAALNAMATLPDIKLLDENGKNNQVILKARFDPEALPSPLRPFAYIDSRWFLSSEWTLCPLVNFDSR